MFAILISEENVPKMQSFLDEVGRPLYTIDVYMSNQKDWFLVRGWYEPHAGLVKDLTVLPRYILDESYEYDPIKIQTDWDQIVRK